MLIVTLPLSATAILAIVFAWILTWREVRAAQAFAWPQGIALAGVLALTILAPLPFAMAVRFIDPHNERGLEWSMRLAVLLFVLALPGAFMHKGLLRWALVLCAIFFLGLTGFIYFVSGIQF